MIFVLRRWLVTNFTRHCTNVIGSQKDAKVYIAGCANVMGSHGCQGQTEDGTLEHVYCRGALTELLKYGPRDLHTAVKRPDPVRALILVIPGNPGVVGFYKTFTRTLYQAFNRRHPVWAVSHAGHCSPQDSMDMVEDASVMESEDVFGVNGQIEHKLAFLLEHVPRDTQLVLIGHSIGCYIILEMMKRDPELKVLKSIMLFPTIERMARTPQGKVLTPALCHLRYGAYLPVFLLSLLPAWLKAVVVRLALGRWRTLDPCVVPAAVGLIDVDCTANAMYMGSQEMRLVLGRDNSTIRKHLHKLIFYYGANDHWCPVEYYHDIRKDFPDGDIRLCEQDFCHAFVLDTGKEMASMTSEWIRDDLQAL
ncbi:lipid droplet-associated hydrolase isoform X2 [Brachyhypopomus gauderio]|uniref:lipid droplet-associated hydrolase isoform X2 n=1 Tax=Brachyhypopomus gauderio TaxID=698409 RepID=UPI0040411276